MSAFPTPSNPRLAMLYSRLKVIHIHIELCFNNDTAAWFSNMASVLQHRRGKALDRDMTTIESILRTLDPYFRAIDVTFDTYAIFFSEDSTWGPRVSAMGNDAREWRSRFKMLLEAYDTSTKFLKNLLATMKM